MSKLTTERLEKFVNDIKTDGMCDITDHQVALALRQLLAYEQAADRPVGEIFICSGNKTLRWLNDVPEGTVLYAAPVLPKQPIVLYMGRELISKEGLELIRDGVSEATKLEGACMASTILGGNHHAQPVSEPKAEGDVLSRLKAEHVELEDRYIKLANFIQVNPEFKKLAPRMQRLLENQTAAMVDYASILECRIDLIEDAAASAQEQK
ncbi:hypothetical protein EYY98_15125 [Obesumbacterium proteus]|nr:hypothetical protein EYY98_15125 [Obesumbacterium proteus]